MTIDMAKTIIAKSDQLNADDLIGKSVTIKITKVSAVAGEQPIAIHFEGDNGKPFMPCKTIRRLLVGVWGADASLYPGRSLTLYRDETVTFGGMAVGGIRVSHMSHIDKPMTMILTATKKTKKPFTVQPLVEQKKPEPVVEKTFIVKLEKGDKVFDDIEEWKRWFVLNVQKIPSDKVSAFIQRNNPIFAEYQKEYPDQIMDVVELCVKADQPAQDDDEVAF